jgi:hypothetical protein
MTYHAGHVKRDPETGSVAIRTINSDTDPFIRERAWLISTTYRGSEFATTERVGSWDDLFVPDPPADPSA